MGVESHASTRWPSEIAINHKSLLVQKFILALAGYIFPDVSIPTPISTFPLKGKV